MIDNKQRLYAQALGDLGNRAKSGIYIYMGIWLMITVPYQFPKIAPVFFFLNTALLFALSALRLFLLKLKIHRPDLPVLKMTDWLVYTILLTALHWGLMVAWVLYDDKTVEIRQLMLISTAALGIGGASILSISNRVRIYLPVLLFCPAIMVMMYQGTSNRWEMAGVASMALLYAIIATKITHKDYWDSITNQAVAENRADKMEQLSITDQLTQLKNRLYFDNKFEEEWQRCSRMKVPLSVLLMDIDNFKAINDTYGHLIGDECLRQIASTISSELHRASDCVARFGGDEFVALLPNADEDETRVIAEKLIRAISSAKLKFNNKKIQITCSIGTATTQPDYNNNKQELLSQADLALYQAKTNGRNQYQFFGPDSKVTT